MTAPVRLAEVVRSGFIEGHHYGSLVVLDAAGDVLLSRGDVVAPVFPRSSLKPLQAVGMLRSGLDVGGELLASVAASHSGEPFHVDAARRILAGAQLDETYLRNTPDLPLDEAAARAVLRSGGGPTSILANCSGKHAGMVATCVRAGWSTPDYLDPLHPLQAVIAQAVEDLAGEPIAATGVDGCGAPAFAVSLIAMARAFRALVLAEPGTAGRTVADAMRAYPQYVAGTGREDTLLMAGVPGLLAKAGAEGVHVVALADGSALAVKIDDGASRARGPITVAALRALGVSAPVLDELAETPVLGAGVPVGAVRALPL